MRSIRRVGGLAVAGILLTAVVGGSAASADTPASYTGSASGHALKLAVGTQNLTAGSSSAVASSAGTSEATGAGVLSPAQATTIATAKNPPGETIAEKCGSDAANAILSPLSAVVKLGLGCGTAAATGTGLATVSSATGKVATAGVDISTLVNAVPLPVVPTLTGAVGTVTTTVDTICASLPASPLPVPTVCQDLTNTVDTLVQSITATSLLGAEAGTSTSGVSVAGASVTSESTAAGAVIKLVPTPQLDGVALPEALATITVARANAKVVCDTGSGNAVPSFDPAIVRVKLGAPLADLIPVSAALPIPGQSLPANPVISGTFAPTVSYQAGELTITPGSTVTLLPGTPLETVITVGAGSSKVTPDGATAVADGVSINALKNIGTADPSLAPLTGGVLLSLAHAEAAGACVAATVTPAPTAAPDVPRELPRTGGTPWLPVAGVAALALAVLTRRAVSSR
jgi:hypothetical protein